MVQSTRQQGSQEVMLLSSIIILTAYTVMREISIHVATCMTSCCKFISDS